MFCNTFINHTRVRVSESDLGMQVNKLCRLENVRFSTGTSCRLGRQVKLLSVLVAQKKDTKGDSTSHTLLRIILQFIQDFALKAKAYSFICFTIDKSPLARVGERCSFNPI